MSEKRFWVGIQFGSGREEPVWEVTDNRCEIYFCTKDESAARYVFDALTAKHEAESSPSAQ